MPVASGMTGGFGVCLTEELRPLENFCVSLLVMNVSIQWSSKAVWARCCKLRCWLKSGVQGHAVICKRGDVSSSSNLRH